MKKTKLTRSLLAACSIVALSVVLSGCLHSSDDTAETEPPMEPTEPVDPGPTDEEIAAATAAAATKATAIAAEAAQGAADNPDAGLGGSDHVNEDTTVNNDDDPHSLAVSRDRDGTTITITAHGATDAMDLTFTQAMDLGGGITMHVLAGDPDMTTGAVMDEVVMVRTTIEEPTATAFAMVANQALNVDIDPAMDADNDGTADNDLTALAVGANLTTAPDEAVLGLAMSDAFTAGSGASVVHTFPRYQLDSDGTTPGNQTIQAYTTSGTYNGAMGTYRCSDASSDCTVTVDADGDITAMSTGWAFIPDDGATSDVPDADYMSYGFWLARTLNSDGDVTSYNEVETFAMSSIDASGDVSSVLGTATYSGDALGVYVRNVYDPHGHIDTATSGHFTADVSLTATFGQVPVSDTDSTGTIADNMLNTLSGTISNFDLSGGDDNEWAVNLMQTSITPGTGVASGMAQGGGPAGSYNATFHGDVTAVDGVVPHPSSVVGEFNANFSNGSVAGGFGAEED